MPRCTAGRSSRRGRLLAGAVGPLRPALADAARRRAGRRRHARRALVRRRAAQLRGAGRAPCRGSPPPACRPWSSATSGCSARAAASRSAGAGWPTTRPRWPPRCAPGRAAWRPRGRLPAQRAAGPVGFLACASLGAIWSLCAPDMGVGTVRDRFRQIDPVVLIACDGTVYGGKTTTAAAPWPNCCSDLPSVHTLVRVPVLEEAGGVIDGRGPFVRHRPAGRPRAGLGRRAGWQRARAAPSRCPSNTRCGSSIQQRHHRPAQAHRARPRRRGARDAEAARLPPRPAAQPRPADGRSPSASTGTAAPAG
jgi:hypothetical protein